MRDAAAALPLPIPRSARPGATERKKAVKNQQRNRKALNNGGLSLLCSRSLGRDISSQLFVIDRIEELQPNYRFV